MYLIHIEGNPAVYLYYGTGMFYIDSVEDEAAFVAAGVPAVGPISQAQFELMPGAPKL